MADLRDLTYSIAFEGDDGGLKNVLNVEKEVDSGLKNITQSATSMGKGFDDAGNKTKKISSGLKEVANAGKGVESSHKNSNNELDKSVDKFSKVKNESEKTKSSAKATVGIFARFKTALQGAGDKLSEVALKTNEVKEKSQKSEFSLKSMGKAIAGAFVTKKVIDFGKSSATVFADFEQAMANTKATMGKISDVEYKKLWNAAKEAGATTRFSATQGADALYYLASAGFDTNKAISTLPSLLNLASAGGIELDRASELVTGSMSALNLQASQLPMFLDQMAVTAQKSNTDIDQLGEGIMTVGSVAKDSGMDTASLNTELAILANAGVKGAEGGTALRNVLLNLTAPTGKVKEELKNLGVEVADSKGKIRPLNDILVDLKGKMKGMTQEQQQSIKAMIGGKENVASLSVLLDGAGGKYENLRKQILDSKGASEEMANTQNNTVKGAFDELTSAIEDAQISMFDSTSAGDGLKQMFIDITAAIPGIKNELQYAMDKFGEFASFVLENKEIIVPAIATIVTTIEGLKIIGFITGLYNVWTGATEATTGAQMMLNTVMNANPIALVITAVVGLVTFLIILYNTSETARNVMNGFFGMIRDVGVMAINSLIAVVNLAIDGLNGLISLVNKLPGIDIGPIKRIAEIGGKSATNDSSHAPGKSKSERLSGGRIFAKGTHNAPGGPSLVGEQGPEIVNLNKGDTVTPANTTRRLFNQDGGGSMPNININVAIHDSGNPTATGRAVAQIVKEEIASIFNNASVQLGYTDI